MRLSVGGDTEAVVMDVVWSAAGPVTVREILTAVNAGRSSRPLAYTTVQTVVTNLADKGLLRRDGRERAHRFEAAVSRAEFTATLMTQALASTPDRTAALLQLMTQLSETERAAMLKHVRRMQGRR